jgi:hypothetical protein
MSIELLKSLLSIILPILGIIVGIFKDEIVNYLFGSRKYKYLKGQWACEWKEESNKRNPNGKTINDSITIRSVYGEIVKGKGSTGVLGEWSINGQISESAITISYKPKKDKLKHNLGIIILEVNDSIHNELTGKWFQYNGLEVVGGDTKWIKI